jgi:pyruvate,water dikinase
VKGSEQIEQLMQGFADPESFFVDKLSAGIGMIAAAFYPKPVIVRTSDFKTNEYQHMLGGEAYEQDEENPMIGFRGASRYYSDAYKEAFKWECVALKKVRDEMGLTNVKVMLPFVRTPDEGRRVIAIMNEMDLVQGQNELQIYAMCEIPSNVIMYYFLPSRFSISTTTWRIFNTESGLREIELMPCSTRNSVISGSCVRFPAM